MVPFFTCGVPVTELPGLTPRSPVITDAPVLVTSVPPSTANGVAFPSPTDVGEADADGTSTAPAKMIIPVAVPAKNRETNHQRREL